MYLEWLELQSGLKSEKSCNLEKLHCLPIAILVTAPEKILKNLISKLTILGTAVGDVGNIYSVREIKIVNIFANLAMFRNVCRTFPNTLFHSKPNSEHPEHLKKPKHQTLNTVRSNTSRNI